MENGPSGKNGNGHGWRAAFFTLRARVTVSFGLLFLILFAITFFIQAFGVFGTDYRGIITESYDSEFRTLDLSANLAKSRMESWWDERRADINEEALSITVKEQCEWLVKTINPSVPLKKQSDALFKSKEYQRLLERIQLPIKVYGDYKEVFIADAATGKVIVSTDEKRFGADISSQRLFLQGLNSDDPVVSALEGEPQRNVFVISRPVFSPRTGKRIALIGMTIDINELLRSITSVAKGLGEGGEIVLVDKETGIFAAMPAGEAISRPRKMAIKLSPDSPGARAVKGEEGSGYATDYRGVEVLGSWRTVDIPGNLSWGLVIKVDKDVIDARTAYMFKFVAAAEAVLLAFALVGVYLIARGVTRPIAALSGTAKKAEQGDLSARAPERATGEVGELIHNFNRMIASIEAGKRELEEEIAHRKEIEENLRHATAELARSNKDLEQFAYISSHDLQEPLRTIVSFLQLLRRKQGNSLDPDSTEYMRFITDAADRMKSLINDLLAYSRVERKGEEFRKFKMEDAVKSAMANLHSSITESGAAITFGPLPSVFGDPRQITQVIQNLIGNAIKFRSAAPPAVHITAEKRAGFWEFRVRDNGIGISKEFFDRIFIIFQRLHTMSEYGGTGIGLAICKKIIERHHGKIWVEAEMGEGSIFFFTLPDSG